MRSMMEPMSSGCTSRSLTRSEESALAGHVRDTIARNAPRDAPGVVFDDGAEAL